MADLQTIPFSIVISTQSWLVWPSDSTPPPTAPIFTFTDFKCPPINQEQPMAVPGVLTAVPVAQPQSLPSPTYLLTAGSTGTNIPYKCAYTINVLHTLDSASPLPTLTGDPATSKTQKGTTRQNPPAETKSPDSSAPNLSTAAVSGIGIGAFVLGILLGLIAAGCWLCSRRRPSRHNGMTPNGEERSVMLLSAPPVPPPKDPTTTSPSSQAQSSLRVTPISAAAPIPHASSLGHANILHSLQGANDDQIAKEVEFMGDMIEEHVKNNYHLKRVNIDYNMLRESMDGLYLDESMRDQIAALAMEPHTRHVAIRHFLALSIFSALDVHYAHAVSLLPPGVSAFMRSLPCERPEDYNYSTIVLDTWRRASAYLLNSNTDKTTPLSPQEVGNLQIETFHAAVNRFLSHFAHEDSRAVFDQTKNLEGVIYECVVFGYSIFSHPCLWRYTYIQNHQSTSSDLEKTSLIVLPGLEKLTGLGGEVLAHPEVLVNPTIVSV